VKKEQEGVKKAADQKVNIDRDLLGRLLRGWRPGSSIAQHYYAVE
jgi:hypothetical protein